MLPHGTGEHAPTLTAERSLSMDSELRRIGQWGAASVLLAGIGFALAVSPAFALQWTIITTLLWFLVWHLSQRRLPLNRPAEGAPLYASLGLANRITVLRGFLIALTGGFIGQAINDTLLIWIPAFLYSLAAILDRVDGYVARRQRHTSLLGNALDTVFDALGLLIAPLLAVDVGKAPASYLMVSAAYYLFHLGLRWRTQHGKPVYPLVPNTLRRTLAGFQMGYIAVVLWPPFNAAVTVPAGFAFMLPLLIGFAVDWGVVSGRIRATEPPLTTFFTHLARGSESLLQPCLRVLGAGALGWILFQHEIGTLAAVGCGTAALALLLGIGARIAALAVLVILALSADIPTDSDAVMCLLWASVGVLLLGGGRGSLWRWDDHWVTRHDGAS